MVQNIQVLRAVAALMVVLHHLQMRMHLELGSPHFGFAGGSGVDLFFVISGFIMFHTTRNGDRTLSQFWTDRVIRIAPLYWLVTFLSVGLFLAGLHPVDSARFDLPDLIADLFFIPNVRTEGDLNPIADVGWTLNYEMYFYLLFGLTFFLRSQVIALVVMTSVFVIFWAIDRQEPGLPFALAMLMKPIALEFAAGGLLALLYREPIGFPPREARVAGWSLIAVGIAAIIGGAALFGDRTDERTLFRTIVFGAPAMMIVFGALILEKAGFVAKNRFLLLLGAASYAIYLIHSLVLQYALLSMEQVDHPDTALMILDALLAFALAVGAGIVLHLWLEKPMHRLLSRWLKRRRKTPDPAPPAIQPAE